MPVFTRFERTVLEGSSVYRTWRSSYPTAPIPADLTAPAVTDALPQNAGGKRHMWPQATIGRYQRPPTLGTFTGRHTAPYPKASRPTPVLPAGSGETNAASNVTAAKPDLAARQQIPWPSAPCAYGQSRKASGSTSDQKDSRRQSFFAFATRAFYGLVKNQTSHTQPLSQPLEAP